MAETVQAGAGPGEQDIAKEVFGLLSKSPKMRKVFDLIEQIAPLGSTVLVTGETGTGKELIAQAIHYTDVTRKGPLVAINCAAFPDELLESELFGYERGAFIGADRRKKGRFESAKAGTLLLDEIGDLSLGMQAKLLRVLQSGTFERVGDTETLQLDARIVAASNKRLEDEVKAGRFRSDLFYRLNVIRIDLPPLRERAEDIPLLAMHFLEEFTHIRTPPVTEIDPEAMQALVTYNWPGNVRELKHAVEAATAMADSTVIRREALPASVVLNEADDAIAHGHPKLERSAIPADLVIVWDPAVVREARYAKLVSLLGDLARAEGGLGVERIRSLGIGVPDKAGVLR